MNIDIEANMETKPAPNSFWRELFWKATNEGFAALKADPEAWAEEVAERELWEQTIGDGVEAERN